ncbi:hypothetical protein ASZ90_018154 [hydrocarbon metagenome]|uniref:PAS domain-containing protein n=1 Tax=hydrocarbon metagenome TaxID=938273 RepID=A0A0W8E7H2_9ZZZZ
MTAAWIQEFPAAITVCDNRGIITAMNKKSALLFAKSGGYELIGKSLLDCHPPEAQEMIKNMLITQRDNHYISEKEGSKKLIIQSPWYEGNQFMGLVEIVKELPDDLPVYHR